MKTIFLMTVLFVLLAFAFKSPQQSAWEFATEFGSNVTEKMKVAGKEENTFQYDQSPKRLVEKKIEDIRTLLEGDKTPVKPSDEEQTVSSKEELPPDPSELEAQPQAPQPLVEAQPLAEDVAPKPSIKRGPNLPARPVDVVSSDKLEDPKVETLSSPSPEPADATTRMGKADLAEIGTYLDRASRLLSDIK